MNRLVWDKLVESAHLCSKKTRQLALKHPFKYCFSIFKEARQWNYYMAAWERISKEMEWEINDESN